MRSFFVFNNIIIIIVVFFFVIINGGVRGVRLRKGCNVVLDWGWGRVVF